MSVAGQTGHAHPAASVAIDPERTSLPIDDMVGCALTGWAGYRLCSAEEGPPAEARAGTHHPAVNLRVFAFVDFVQNRPGLLGSMLPRYAEGKLATGARWRPERSRRTGDPLGAVTH